ncbi:MAG: hypothetical protein SGI83_03060 [Bacteroidota bacterium]|nr:hypothetical protein [Bacteroidota bacterium]
MKKLLLLFAPVMLCNNLLLAQDDYPEPEFSNEICLYSKDSDSANKFMRLEKTSSKINNKLKTAGLGGAESSCTIEGQTSPVRLSSGNILSFVFSTGGNISSAYLDSLKSNGLKAIGLGGGDPSNSFILYKVSVENGKRKIILHKNSGIFGSKKNGPSEKQSVTITKIREGYWELLTAEALSQGEYAFAIMSTGLSSISGSVSLFAFAVD